MSKRLPLLRNLKSIPEANYGYVIVAACFLIMTLTFGSQGSFGVFFKPMSAEFGWSRATTSGPVALNMLFGGILGFFSGRFSDRFGPRKVVTCGAILIGLGLILMSQTQSIWQLYLFYGILVSAGASTMYVPIVALIARWFDKRRGLMSGIGIAGIGFGIGVMPIISSHLMDSFNWHISLMVVGIMTLVLAVLLAQLLKNKPAAIDSPGAVHQDTPQVAVPLNVSFQKALHTRQFWMIFIAWVGYGYFFQIGVIHIVPYASDLGMTAVAAATILSVIGLIGTLGRISLGFIGDKLGNRRTMYVSYSLIGLSYVGLALSHTIGMLYVFAVVFGFLFGIGILLVPTIAEYFGFKELGSISGAMVFANNIGGALGPPTAGAIFDATSSYELAFISCVVAALITAACIWLIRPMRSA